jgi:hypothetical protein
MIQPRLTFEEQIRLTQEEELVEFWREHPVEAQKDIIGYNLNWFQRIMLRSFWDKTFLLWIMGRGCSKTFMTGLCTSLYAVLYPDWSIGIVAPGLRQANYVFDFIQKIYDISPYFRRSVSHPISRTPERSIIKFHNGSFIEALPPGVDGSKIRGRRYRALVIDEAAQCDSAIISNVIMPFLSVKVGGMDNKVVWTSSAYWKWSYLYPLYLYFRVRQIEEPNKYSVLEYDYNDVLVDNTCPEYTVDMNVLNFCKETMTDAEFQMEWLAKFPDESTGFFPSKTIDKCLRRVNPIEIEPIKGEPGFIYTLGIDCARSKTGDNFAASIAKIVGKDMHLVSLITYRGITFQEMRDFVRSVYENYNIGRIELDIDGGGSSIRDLISEGWMSSNGRKYPALLEIGNEDQNHLDGERIVKTIKFAVTSKREMFSRVKTRMEQGRIVMPLDIRNDPDASIRARGKDLLLLKTELSVVEAHQTVYGITLRVPQKYSDDRLTSYCLAIDAACDLIGEGDIYDEPLPMGVWA